MAWNVHWMILQAYLINWNGKGTHCFAGMPWLALWMKWQAPSMAWDVHCISRQAPVIAWDVMWETYIFHSRHLGRNWDIKRIFRPVWILFILLISYILTHFYWILENLLFFNEICALRQVLATKKYQNCSLIIQIHFFYTFEIFRP